MPCLPSAQANDFASSTALPMPSNVFLPSEDSPTHGVKVERSAFSESMGRRVLSQSRSCNDKNFIFTSSKRS
eukprot:8899954-Pyramimonas_sp.AAC.1